MFFADFIPEFLLKFVSNQLYTLFLVKKFLNYIDKDMITVLDTTWESAHFSSQTDIFRHWHGSQLTFWMFIFQKILKYFKRYEKAPVELEEDAGHAQPCDRLRLVHPLDLKCKFFSSESCLVLYKHLFSCFKCFKVSCCQVTQTQTPLKIMTVCWLWQTDRSKHRQC